ncbi:hypothetical protein NWP17_10325 [Chrysosporum bergii ANA360D]|jgi:hypothetical protein|uniref:Uncharacterized protein n=1 Tax=Chrysosporum bergii ANA360D TaxID=617107 RepID=A0AA43GSD3_9CYAN|nr:hypothetical protein [Chrysosporum bergii]MDH6060829.1 hypothetical protein [Chrysosporum bergii ANA360D]
MNDLKSPRRLFVGLITLDLIYRADSASSNNQRRAELLASDMGVSRWPFQSPSPFFN